ncbi:hypothetical protein A7D16_04800 [Xanthomonas nasturtii]|nr:hypothetical protein A7D16_04800 [Xanthomonas nasturtii]
MAPAKPAPRNTRSAPLTTNAPHLKVDDTLWRQRGSARGR